MSQDAVLVDERSGALWVTFNRPAHMNPLDQVALQALDEAVERAERTEPVALIVTGRGSAFCAGADLKWVKAHLGDGLTREFKSFLSQAASLLTKLEDLPVPVIAGVNGTCVAGGLEIICTADLVVAAETARIADGHANFGLVPLGGTASRLAKRVGLSNAKRLLLTGEFISADEALRMGLANWVVPDQQLEARLDQLCQTLEAKSPEVLRRMKLISNHAATDPDEGQRYERTLALEHLASDIVKEGVAAFTERRTPQFR